MLGKFVLLAMVMLFNSQCGKKVAELYFIDNTKLEKEVGESFDLVVNVKDIDIDNIDNDNISSFNDLKQDDLLVTLKVTEGGKAKDILSNRYHSEKVIKTRIENGKAKFEACHFKEVCVKDCRIVVGLGIYELESDGNYRLHVIKQVDEISKQVVVSESSYVMQMEKSSSNNIKLTITNNDAPLANKSAVVRARAPCLLRGWNDTYCHDHGISVHTSFSFYDHSITLDASGSWSTELDADGSWGKKVDEDTEGLCDLTLSVEVDDRVLTKKLAGNKGCE